MDLIRPILVEHARRYPLWQVEDLYKLLHQAALGSEHAIRDEEAARRWLEDEIADLGQGPVEPLIDPISADDRVVRVHLRPYLQAAHNPDDLLKAFLRTAREYRGSTDLLIIYWHEAVRLAQEARFSFTAQEIDTLFSSLLAQGFPAVHHTATFEQAYHPAYRVVALEFVKDLTGHGLNR